MVMVLAFKQGEEFAHSFNVKQIKCIEAKLTKVTQDMALENIKGSYDSIYIQGHTQTAHQQKEKGKEFMESVLETR